MKSVADRAARCAATPGRHCAGRHHSHAARTWTPLKARAPKPGEASPFIYHDHHFKHDAVKVLPGEYYVTTDDMVIMTVLGSCIAACIWDPQAFAWAA